MKRAPELRGLSGDHHHGLVLARRAKRAGGGEGDEPLAAVWQGVVQRFDEELEPHFRIEERYLAPALERHGQTAPVRRLLTEHAALRACVAPEAGRTAEDLRHFGELLEQHIRFEERELFPVAEAHLGPDELEAIEKAHRPGGPTMSEPEDELHGEARPLAGLVDYQPGAVVSRTLVKKTRGSVTLFAFDAGQELSEHTVPHDALVQVLDGQAEITVAGRRHRLERGDAIVMPGGRPHAVRATARFKMCLTMIRE